MKRTLTALSIAALGILSAGSSFAYQTFLGEDANGDPTSILLSLPNSTNAQLAFFGLGTPQVENFESQVVGPGPLTLALSFYMAAQGSLIIYMLIIGYYAMYMRKLDIEHGVDEGEQE